MRNIAIFAIESYSCRRTRSGASNGSATEGNSDSYRVREQAAREDGGQNHPDAYPQGGAGEVRPYGSPGLREAIIPPPYHAVRSSVSLLPYTVFSINSPYIIYSL